MLGKYFRPMLYGLLLAAVALGSAIFTMRRAIHGDEVAVPQLAGMGLAEAENKTAALGLGLDVENRYYSAIVPAGRVIAQLPMAGSVVRREWQVRVTESLGPQKVAIPDVTGEPMRAAAIAIERVGLEMGSVVHLPGTGTVPDVVIAQSPPATATGADSPRVSLLVSAPETPTDAAYVMPDLTGMPYSVASAMVERAGLKLGAAEFQSSKIPAVNMQAALTPMKAMAAPGTVMAQMPLAGERVTAADVVKFTIAK